MAKAVPSKPRVIAYKQRIAKVESIRADRDCVEVIKEGARHVECF
jgi:hypothetical protein